MKIFNTLTRRKEEFVPLEEGKVKIYSCGPTVYNYFHLGNARPFITFDTLRRYLEYLGYEVSFVQNFTDIDDKMISGAKAEGVSVKELADHYIEAYFEDARGLNIKDATVHPRATECIEDIVNMVKTLVDKGYAYPAKDGVYYAARKFKNYCCLSGYDIDDLRQNVRKDVMAESGKKDPADFALWKFKKEGEPYWPSPWGDGRPGWHIECSVMSTKYLGDSIDIHAGGQDLIFPQHENEIAQSEAATGKPFVKYWMHNGFITVDNEKMSKSEGNFFLVREIAEKYGYMPIRLFMLNSHYRSPINFSDELIHSAASAYKRIETSLKNLDFVLAQPFEADAEKEAAQEKELTSASEEAEAEFRRSMDDDLNTADALAAVFELVRKVNIALSEPASEAGLAKAKEVLLRLLDVLGLRFELEDEIPREIRELAEARQKAKEARNYEEADRLRDQISEKGYKVTDTPQGPHLEADV